MIKDWKISLLLSLVCFGIPCFILYSYTFLPPPLGFFFLIPFIPIIAFVFIVFILAGLVTFTTGVIGEIRVKESGSKKFLFIIVLIIALMIFLTAIRLSSVLN